MSRFRKKTENYESIFAENQKIVGRSDRLQHFDRRLIRNGKAGSPEEYKGAVHGSISYFGKCSVDENAKAINFEFEASSFPNWDGVVQKRPFSIFGDEMRFTNSSGSSGGSVIVVLKRLK